MGHGLEAYTKKHGGNKMRIDFTEGAKRPLDHVQAAKLSSQFGVHVRNKMLIATHWKEYEKGKELENVIPDALVTVAVSRHSYDIDHLMFTCSSAIPW